MDGILQSGKLRSLDYLILQAIRLSNQAKRQNYTMYFNTLRQRQRKTI